MDSSSATASVFKCAICLVDAFDHSAQGESHYLGKTVRLDCSCKSYYHLSCLKEQWGTSVALASALEVDDSSVEYWRIYRDMLAGGVDPDTFEFEDVPVRKDKECPICRRKILEVGYVTNMQQVAQDTSGSAAATTIEPAGSVHVKGTEVAESIVPEVRKGKSFSIHNIRAFVSELREKLLISPELPIDEKKLVTFIHSQLAETDMTGQEAQKRVIAYLLTPTMSEFLPAAFDLSTYPQFRPCSQLTPMDICGWVNSMKAIGRIDDNIDIEIDLLASFIMHELGNKDFNLTSVQDRVVQFINSQTDSLTGV